MTEKNRAKVERKEKRKPPIPFTRKTPTKKEKELRQERKHKKGFDD